MAARFGSKALGLAIVVWAVLKLHNLPLPLHLFKQSQWGAAWGQGGMGRQGGRRRKALLAIPRSPAVAPTSCRRLLPPPAFAMFIVWSRKGQPAASQGLAGGLWQLAQH